MKLSLQIAVRFLKTGGSQTFFIILGIAIGVSVQVFIGSLISGLQDSLVDKTIGNASHITISNEANISDYELLIEEIDEEVSGIKVLSPNININGTLIKDATTPVQLKGFNFSKANDIYEFDEKLIEGRLPNIKDEIVLGSEIKEDLGLSIGETILIEVPTIGSTELMIVGFFDFNVAIVNKSWAITLLDTVQSIRSVGDVVSKIEIQVLDSKVFDVEDIAAKVTTLLDDEDLVVDNWIDNNQELLSGLQGQSTSSIMIQVFVMVSVVLGIGSILAIIVLQKSKQLGILKAMGIQNKDASLVFLFQGLILGVLGAILGILLGLGLSVMFTTFAVNDDGTPVVPLLVDFGFIAFSAIIAIIAALVASVIPARKSSKLTVMEVIRNG